MQEWVESYAAITKFSSETETVVFWDSPNIAVHFYPANATP